MSDLNAPNPPAPARGTCVNLSMSAGSLALDLTPPSSELAESGIDGVRLVRNRFGCLATSFACLRAKHAPAAAHSLRVSYWASAWGLRNDCSEEELVLLEVLGLLHEIGKVGVPDRLLQRTAELLEHEFSMLESHWEIGYEIILAMDLRPEILTAFRYLCPAILLQPSQADLNSSSSIHEMRLAKFAELIRIVDLYDTKLYSVDEGDTAAPPKEVALAGVVSLAGGGFEAQLANSFVELVLTIDEGLRDKIAQRWMGKLDVSDLLSQVGGDSPKRLLGFGSSAVQTLNDTFYRHMMDQIEHGVVFIDSEYRVLDWNAAAERLTGRTAKHLLHQTWSPHMAGLCDTSGYPLSDSGCPFRDLIEHGVAGKKRLSIRTPEDSVVQVTIDVVPVISDRGMLCGGAMIIEDESATTELEKKIQHLSRKVSLDQLTNLANRGELNRQLPEFLEYHQGRDEPASVIICDIDYFKKINDTYSHQAGDDALIAFAKLLKDSCREVDFVARFGGEEFVILCAHCNLAEAKQLAENMRIRLQRTPIPSLRSHCLTASFGVATVEPEDTCESVLGRADHGLLIAKESGRDRVVALGGVDSGEEVAAKPPRRSLMEWIIAPAVKAIKAELLTNVPRAVTLEKLKGFVHEFQAVVQEVDSHRLVIDIDCKTAPIPKRRTERLSKFRMTICISDVEMKVSGNASNVKVCTLLDIEVASLRTRDRRIDEIRSQAYRLKTALQGYLVAHEMAPEFEQDILRRFNASEEAARY